MRSSIVGSQYLDYRTAMNTGAPLVWTSIYFLPNDFYGSDTIVLRPEVPLRYSPTFSKILTSSFSSVQNGNVAGYGARSIDLNFYNFVHGGMWVYPMPGRTGMNLDVGEFVTPGYIEGSEVEAIIFRDEEHVDPAWDQAVTVEQSDGTSTSITTDLYPASHVKLALVRDSWVGNAIVLVVDGTKADGERSFCIDKDEDGRWVYCGREFHPYPRDRQDEERKNNPRPGYPLRTREQVRVMGKKISPCPIQKLMTSIATGLLSRCDPAQCHLEALREELSGAGRQARWNVGADLEQKLTTLRFVDDGHPTLYITRF
jgi:hypothetical protein